MVLTFPILGMVSGYFYLASDFYIPKRTMQKFDDLTTSLVENGIFQFFDSLKLFWIQTWGRSDTRIDRYKDQFEYADISLKEFRIISITYVCLLVGIIIIFIIEFIWPHIQRRFTQILV